jgi:hypothetical protein
MSNTCYISSFLPLIFETMYFVIITVAVLDPIFITLSFSNDLHFDYKCSLRAMLMIRILRDNHSRYQLD